MITYVKVTRLSRRIIDLQRIIDMCVMFALQCMSMSMHNVAYFDPISHAFVWIIHMREETTPYDERRRQFLNKHSHKCGYAVLG